MGLGAKTMKGYSTFPKNPALLKPHHQIFTVISKTFVWGVLLLCRDSVAVFYSPNRLGILFRSKNSEYEFKNGNCIRCLYTFLVVHNDFFSMQITILIGFILLINVKRIFFSKSSVCGRLITVSCECSQVRKRKHKKDDFFYFYKVSTQILLNN